MVKTIGRSTHRARNIVLTYSATSSTCSGVQWWRVCKNAPLTDSIATMPEPHRLTAALAQPRSAAPAGPLDHFAHRQRLCGRSHGAGDAALEIDDGLGDLGGPLDRRSVHVAVLYYMLGAGDELVHLFR